MIKVRVLEVGGVSVDSLELEEGSTVGQALRKAGARTDVPKQVRVNADEANLDDILEHGDSIYVVPNIKGNK